MSHNDPKLESRNSTAPVAGPGEFIRWLGRRSWALIITITWVLAASTPLSFLARSHWLADIGANLRVQQLIALATVMLFTTCVRRWRWLVFQTLIAIFHLPYFFGAFAGGPAGGNPEMVLMVANVLTSNTQHDRILQQVRETNPDVFAILELSTPLLHDLQEEFSVDYPHSLHDSQDSGNFGIGIWSRFPLKSSERFELNVGGISSVEVIIEHRQQLYRIIATHPLPPVGHNGFQKRNEHLRQLADRITRQQHLEPNDCLVVMGDLNLTPWSPIFEDFKNETKLSRAGRGCGVTPTWYARPAFPFGLVLDHILLSDNLRCTNYRVGNDLGSDHRPVIAGVTLKRQE